MRVPCVAGRQQSGLLVGSLPTLGLQFTYYEEGALKELATRSVQLKLQGLTPRALSLYLPPKRVALDEVVVRLPRKEPRSRSEPAFPTLDQVAEPLGQRSLRRQFSRAWERDEVVRELATLRTQTEDLANLEIEADALIEQYASITPEGLDLYTPEDRHQAYKELRLKVIVHADGSMEADGVFNLDSAPLLCTTEALRA